MSKIEIKDLYLIFGHEKQKALKMLKKDKSKEEILKDTGCTVGVKDANLSINEGEFFCDNGTLGKWKIDITALYQSSDTSYCRASVCKRSRYI